jgi:hypothetical protein
MDMALDERERQRRYRENLKKKANRLPSEPGTRSLSKGTAKDRMLLYLTRE